GDASVEALSSDGRFDHAYAAVRSMGQAALLASGFAVPKGSRQHERVIESIRFTLGDEWSTEVDYYDRCRRMRHQSMYDHSGVAQESDAQELVSSAKRLFEALREWLSDRHADLYDRRE
ncbi:MAG: hypothetical protein IIB61_08120, partial [Planctomycetes bacterium]|nr:hypothetical protein [Planctomycetota bacterium]